MINYIVTILAVIGAVLNIKKLRAGFILWQPSIPAGHLSGLKRKKTIVKSQKNALPTLKARLDYLFSE